MRSVLYVLSIVLIGSAFCAQAKMYKWVDDEGQVHFGDKVPVKFIEKAHDELNNQGVVIKRKAAERTAEQKLQDKRLAKLKKQQALKEKRRKQQDRVLLATYTTERDLILARDARLDAVESQIKLADTIVRDSNKNLVQLNKQVKNIEASDREVPADIYGRLAVEREQVKTQSLVMAQHKKRRDEISKQFDGYIKRFKELKVQQKLARERLAKERGLNN